MYTGNTRYVTWTLEAPGHRPVVHRIESMAVQEAKRHAQHGRSAKITVRSHMDKNDQRGHVVDVLRFPAE